MAMITIKNEEVQASFQLKGGELVSVEDKHGCEYIWQGDPAFWGRHAPVLFPVVGRLKEDQYVFDGKTYSMSQHGFARDFDFKIVSQTETAVVFQLSSSEETLKIYPFDFILQLSYELIGRKLVCGYHVGNPQKEAPLYFSIGGHPAFNVPLEEGLQFEDYQVTVSPSQEYDIVPLAGSWSDFANMKRMEVDTFPLSREAFIHDAFILHTPAGASFTVESKKGERKVCLSFGPDEIEYLGIWSPYPKEAPFVCLEPWCGIADTVDADGLLQHKKEIQTLAAGERFNKKYEISFL